MKPKAPSLYVAESIETGMILLDESGRMLINPNRSELADAASDAHPRRGRMPSFRIVRYRRAE